MTFNQNYTYPTEYYCYFFYHTNSVFILCLSYSIIYENEMDKLVITSRSLTNCLAVGAETMMRRAVGETKPSSTALSINDSNEL